MRGAEALALVERQRAGGVLAVDVEGGAVEAVGLHRRDDAAEERGAEAASAPRRPGAELAEPARRVAVQLVLLRVAMAERVRRDLVAVEHEEAEVGPEVAVAGEPLLPLLGAAL